MLTPVGRIHLTIRGGSAIFPSVTRRSARLVAAGKREMDEIETTCADADESDVRSIAFNLDGKGMVTASDNKTTRLALAKTSPE